METRFVLRRIVSAGVPGMTTHDASDAFQDAADHAVLLDRFQRVLAARGSKPAIGAQHRADKSLVKADRQNEQPANQRSLSREEGFVCLALAERDFAASEAAALP